MPLSRWFWSSNKQQWVSYKGKSSCAGGVRYTAGGGCTLSSVFSTFSAGNEVRRSGKREISFEVGQIRVELPWAGLRLYSVLVLVQKWQQQPNVVTINAANTATTSIGIIIAAIFILSPKVSVSMHTWSYLTHFPPHHLSSWALRKNKDHPYYLELENQYNKIHVTNIKII